LVRGFGVGVVFYSFGADSLFGDEFDGGGEEVMKESPFLGVEAVEKGDSIGVI
jgi:hypothetical protein